MNRIYKVCLIALTLPALPRATNMIPYVAAQSEPLQRGISVQLAVTRNAMPMPDADDLDALVLTITDSGSIYFGTDPIELADMAERVRGRLATRSEQKVYIKADARAQYASVSMVLDAAQRAGVEAPGLLTALPDWSKPGTPVPPKGLDVLIGPSAAAISDSVTVELAPLGSRRPEVTVNNKEIPLAKLQRTLTQTYPNKKVVLLKADGLLPFLQVAHVIDVCRATGATVVLVTAGSNQTSI
jgi:biopolymer transport protein ExbD